MKAARVAPGRLQKMRSVPIAQRKQYRHLDNCIPLSLRWPKFYHPPPFTTPGKNIIYIFYHFTTPPKKNIYVVKKYLPWLQFFWLHRLGEVFDKKTFAPMKKIDAARRVTSIYSTFAPQARIFPGWTAFLLRRWYFFTTPPFFTTSLGYIIYIFLPLYHPPLKYIYIYKVKFRPP